MISHQSLLLSTTVLNDNNGKKDLYLLVRVETYAITIFMCNPKETRVHVTHKTSTHACYLVTELYHVSSVGMRSSIM